MVALIWVLGFYIKGLRAIGDTGPIHKHNQSNVKQANNRHLNGGKLKAFLLKSVTR